MRADQPEGGGYGGQVVGCGDQVDVVGPLVLKVKEDGRKPLDAYFFAKSLVADHMVLAEAAAQGASAEKYGPAAAASADAGFLPVVKGSSGYFNVCSALAESGIGTGAGGGGPVRIVGRKARPVSMTLAGAQPAVFVIIGKRGGSNGSFFHLLFTFTFIDKSWGKE
jgi:hypothetical protein